MKAERLYQVLKGPHISEKAANAAEGVNCVVLKVSTDATKLEIKKAVEKIFKVKVAAVKTQLVKGKVKLNRFGAVKKSNWKKAYVRLEQGQEIDFAVGE